MRITDLLKTNLKVPTVIVSLKVFFTVRSPPVEGSGFSLLTDLHAGPRDVAKQHEN